MPKILILQAEIHEQGSIKLLPVDVDKGVLVRVPRSSVVRMLLMQA